MERVPRSQTRFRVAIPRVNFFSQTMVTIHSLNMSSPPHSHSSRTHLVDVHTRFILMLARCNAYRALSTCINSDTVHTRPPHLITSKVSIAHRKVPHTNPTRSHCEGKFRTALEQCEGVLPAQCATVGSHCAGSAPVLCDVRTRARGQCEFVGMVCYFGLVCGRCVGPSVRPSYPRGQPRV